MTDWLIFIVAEYLIYLIVLALPVVIWRGELKLALRGFYSLASAYFIGSIIKYFFPVARPVGGVSMLEAPGSSFPSLHAAMATAVAVSIFLQHRKYGTVLILLAGMVSVARVLANVHYTLDVLVGVLIGVVAAWFIHLVQLYI